MAGAFLASVGIGWGQAKPFKVPKPDFKQYKRIHQKALDLIRTGRAETAVQFLNIVQEKLPKDSETYYMLAVAQCTLGQADAARLIGLAKSEPSSNPNDLAFLIETFHGHDSRWIVSGLLMMIDADGYAVHNDFVRDSLRHADVVVRETALEVFLAYEPIREAVITQCELSMKDACEAIVHLAKRKLSTL